MEAETMSSAGGNRWEQRFSFTIRNRTTHSLARVRVEAGTLSRECLTYWRHGQRPRIGLQRLDKIGYVVWVEGVEKSRLFTSGAYDCEELSNGDKEPTTCPIRGLA
jgi:hypothetical protein